MTLGCFLCGAPRTLPLFPFRETQRWAKDMIIVSQCHLTSWWEVGHITEVKIQWLEYQKQKSDF